jgi:uncharacterized protein YqjF (DUF2071 family)
MTQSWLDLLFAHWPIDADVLRARLPDGLLLDAYDGQAWIGVVPFHMSNVGFRGLNWVPLASTFPELNVRTYVVKDGKPGVYFFSLDAASRIAVATARALFHLPYHFAEMSVHVGNRQVSYRSTRRRGVAAAFAAAYEPVGLASASAPGTLEHFLTERYCLYTVDRQGRVRRLEIHHGPWPLQPAEAQIAVNTMGDAAGITLPTGPPLLHFAKRLDVLAWPLTKA